MEWSEIIISTTTAGAEAMSEVLMRAGAAGTVIEDKLDLQLHDENADWDYVDEKLYESFGEEVSVKGYLPNDSRLLDSLALVRDEVARIKRESDEDFDIGSGTVAIATVDEQDWANEWKKYYKPLRVGKRLMIVPTWEEFSPQPDDIVIELDPGMAFGTGTHETTRMCLAATERFVKPGDKVIDVGCGTAILGIAAAKLGAADVLAIDRDPVAVDAARSNIALNKLAHIVRPVEGDLLKGRERMVAEVIIVNIVADVIISLLPDLKPFLAQGGTVITSGIIKDRREDVLKAAKRAGYSLIEVNEEGEWVCAVFNG